MASQVTGVCYFIPHLADKRGGGGLCRGSGMVWKVGGLWNQKGNLGLRVGRSLDLLNVHYTNSSEDW